MSHPEMKPVTNILARNQPASLQGLIARIILIVMSLYLTVDITPLHSIGVPAMKVAECCKISTCFVCTSFAVT
jgi:hypothetical protein